MISLPIEEVSKTNIFVGLNSSKTRQITIYSNYVSNNSDSNAMIIPVPFPRTVKFHNFSHMRNFFANVDKSFIKQTDNTVPNYTSSLDVFNIGSYKVSLAQSFTELSRLDKDLFILSEGLEKDLLESYKENYWGFIVFVLAKDSKEYHPFAYSHDLLRRTLYIPTKHYHDHINSRSDHYSEFDTNRVEDWSHNIYLFNCGDSGSKSEILKSMLNENLVYKWNKNVYWDKKQIDFDLMECDRFEKYNIQGSHPNLDLMISVF